MEAFETGVSPENSTKIDRYAVIDERNKSSFLMQEGGSLQVLQSLHSVGAPRDILTDSYQDQFNTEIVSRAQKISRVMLAGNMSPLNQYGPENMTVEERIKDAKCNIGNFLSQNEVDPATVRILKPERDYTTPLKMLNLDETPLNYDDTGLLRPDTDADMVYTFDPEVVIAARPADCPIVFISAQTPKGEVTALLHLAWMGVANGYVQQAKQHFNSLAINWDSAQIQITPGGHADSYRFKDFDKFNPIETFPDAASMFVDFEQTGTKDGKPTFSFGNDVAAEVYEQIVASWDVSPRQIFADTTDTTAPESGYSSHSRAHRKYKVHGENSRDLVLARRIKK